jgi:hypothetical protein
MAYNHFNTFKEFNHKYNLKVPYISFIYPIAIERELVRRVAWGITDRLIVVQLEKFHEENFSALVKNINS